MKKKTSSPYSYSAAQTRRKALRLNEHHLAPHFPQQDLFQRKSLSRNEEAAKLHGMKGKTICVRCPEALVKRFDMLAKRKKKTRTDLIMEAVRRLFKASKKRRGRVVPQYRKNVKMDMTRLGKRLKEMRAQQKKLRAQQEKGEA